MKKIYLLLCISIFFISPGAWAQFPKGRVVDLTYSFDQQTIYWPTESGFVLEKETEGMTEKGYFYAANFFQAPEHGGTHIDAPHHFAKNGRTVDEIPLEQLMAEGIVVDVSNKALQDRDYQVTVDEFLDWEKKNGKIPEGAIVFLRTGFGKYWPDRLSYMGTDERGKDAVGKLHFPGLHPQAAIWLVDSRKIKAVGIDTPSIDYGQSTHFGSHVNLFSRNVPALENLANLGELPEKGFSVIALPMKIKGGSGGPTRVVAVIDRSLQDLTK